MEPRDGATAARISEKTATDYLEKRLKPQLEYFERESAQAKRWHRYTSIAQLAATVMIPVVNVFWHSVYLSSALAGVAALAAGWAQIERFQERWMSFRQMAGSLDALRLRYELGLPPLDGADRHDRLVADSEALLGQESSRWYETTLQTASSGAPTILMGG